jgi:serine/threonine-protein kinase
MAPEQLLGDVNAIDARTDVYSLGAILYTILTQQPPHSGMSLQERLLSPSDSQALPPQEVVDFNLPPKLCDIAMKALSPKPDDRQPTALVLKQEVEEFLRSTWHLTKRRYEPGICIIHEGEAGKEAYIIAKGHCRATKLVDGKEITLRDMGPGEVFGETAVLTHEPRSATVRTIDQVTLAVVTREQFDEEMGSGGFLGRFVRTLAERFREKDNRTTMLEQELSHTQLTVKVLEQLSLTGVRSDTGGCQTTWSRLCEDLAASLGQPADEIARLIQLNDMFEVDKEQNVIALNRR